MTELCNVCGADVTLPGPVVLLELRREVGELAADQWRVCRPCDTWTRSWYVSVSW